VRAPVSLRDLPATILDLLRVPAAGRLPGRSLARFWTGGNRAETDTVLSEVTPYQAAPDALWGNGDQMRAMTGMPLRYIHNGGGREEVYDYLQDTLETKDLSRTPLADQNLDALRRVLRPAAGPSPSRP
jgi:arylsulfatase A-like enzyme